LKTVNKSLSALLLICTLVGFSLAEEASFRRIHVPDSRGKPIHAVLTFDDQAKAVLIQPAKANTVSIPYEKIDKFVYEYTRKHHVSNARLATAPVGIGLVAMARKSRSHWLEIDYREREVPKLYVLQMDKRNYLQILEAVKRHTGQDTEILGNADKRRK
jgi:hypothetical protein